MQVVSQAKYSHLFYIFLSIAMDSHESLIDGILKMIFSSHYDFHLPFLVLGNVSGTFPSLTSHDSLLLYRLRTA